MWGKRYSWPCLLKGDQKDTWVTRAPLVGLLPKAQPVLCRAGHCGSWVPLPAKVFCTRQVSRTGSLDVHSLLWCRACTRMVLPVKQLAGMLRHKYEELSSSGCYCDAVLSRLASAVTPLWRLPYQEQLQVRCAYVDFSPLCCPNCPFYPP